MKNFATNPVSVSASPITFTGVLDLIGRYILPLVLVGLAVFMKLASPGFPVSAGLILAAIVIAAIMVAVWFRKATTR